MATRTDLNGAQRAARRYAIIGCGGFIGSHLLDSLLEDSSIHIDGWDPQTDKITQHLSNPNVNVRRSMLRSNDSLVEFRDAVRHADAVINLAAICNPAVYNTNPLNVINANFIEPLQIVNICAEERTWLVHFSTSETYGRTIASYVPGADYADANLYELDEDNTPMIMGPIKNQRWSYAASKQLLERYIYAQHYEHALPFTIVRPLNFFGPRMDFIPGRDGDGVPRVLACFMTALLDGKPMQLVDGGLARRTIISIHDAIAAIRLMLEKPDKAANQIFNIGNRNNEVTMVRLGEMMRDTYATVSGDASHRSHPMEQVSSREFYGDGYEDCDRRMPKIDKAMQLLGWAPTQSLEAILEETVTYYYTHYRNWPQST
jgi:UDP-apiose/xylose synthase